MMKWWLVVAIGCGGSNDKPVEEKKVEEGGLSSRFGSLADKAKEVVGDKAGDLVEKAKEVAAKAGDLSTDALSSGKQLKSDLAGKLDFASSHFDIAIDSASESESDYKARIAGMKQIKVGDYTVGIAEDSKHPLGTVYKWQFRLTWRVPTGQAVRLSLFTDEPLDQLATATNLLTIVQASEKLLKLK